MAEPKMLLEGIKVVDMGTWIAGPVSTTIMSDFGAEVIKVENPGGGDMYRQLAWGPTSPTADVNYGWIVDNRNKKGVALNLKTDEAKEILYKLVSEADVVVTNQPPDVRERLKTTYEDLKKLNPKLIYASINGYGEKGPEADRRAFDTTAYWHRSGLMDLVRPGDKPPSMSLPGMGDHPTAMSLFAGIVLALYRREITGEGSKVRTSLMGNGMWSNAFFLQAMLCGATYDHRASRENARNPYANQYCAKDGRWFSFARMETDEPLRTMCELFGKAEIADDPRFADMESIMANAGSLIQILDEGFAEKTWAEWKPLFDEHGIGYTAVARAEDIVDDEQARIGGHFLPMKDERAHTDRIIDSPIWIQGVDKKEPTLAPGIGEHTDDVLLANGFSKDDIARFKTAGAIPEGQIDERGSVPIELQ